MLNGLQERLITTHWGCEKYKCICPLIRCERGAWLIPESKFFSKTVLMVLGELFGSISIESRAKTSMWISFMLSTEKNKIKFLYIMTAVPCKQGCLRTL